MTDSPSVRIVADSEELARVAAEEFVRLCGDAVRARGSFTAALAGGSTPRGLYTLLASGGKPPYRERIDWTKTCFFSGDERRVPPDHPDSNYRMAYEALYSKVPLAPGHSFRFLSEGPDLEFAVSHYEEMLRGHFKLKGGEMPRFDLVLLGLGRDGHTASLFPGCDALRERNRLAAATWVEGMKTHRFTLTPPVLNAAASVVFLVSGADKAEALREVLKGDAAPARVPARIVRPLDGSLLFIADRAAASRL